MRSASTGFSPAEMLYGVKLTLPYIWSPPAEIEDLEEAIIERIKVIQIDLPKIRDLGYNKLISVKNNSEEVYNKSVSKNIFKVGQKVLLRIKEVGGKFDPLWEGPYEVIMDRANGSYIIADTANNKDSVTGDRLKNYNSSNYMVPEVISRRLTPGIKRYREINRG
ncbi:hypothetical protein BB560_002705, partial [Smittium megazygosporum]